MSSSDKKYISFLHIIVTIFVFSAACSANEDVKLTVKAKDSILSSDFYILTADTDEQNQIRFHRWTPSEEDFQSANIFINRTDEAAVKLTQPADSNLLYGDDVKFPVRQNGLEIEMKTFWKTDYIDLRRNLTPPIRANERTTNVVELIMVLDKELCDKFSHDNRKIMDYVTVYMWDVNMRYKSLQSDSISFVVNGVVVISTLSAQPFIEESRACDGRAENGRILDRFSKWVYSERNSLPKFDIATLMIGARLEWGGGLAYMNGACGVDANDRKNIGTVVWTDDGNWDSLAVGAHEIGHNLGAPHDDDPKFPGGCAEKGYLMSGANDERRWYFSSCSDRLISNFVRSESASCLRRIDGKPSLDTEYASPSAPTMQEQCKLLLNDPNAWIEEKDTSNCKSMRCLKPDKNNPGVLTVHNRPPVDNTVCADQGRCFRGLCRKAGNLIKNVGSGLCLRATDPFKFMAALNMVSCPRVGTPLDRFVVSDTSSGKRLATPFTIFKDENQGVEEGDRCAWTGNKEGGAMWTDRCDAGNPWHGWDFRDAGNSRFLLVHRITGRCAKPENRSAGSRVLTYGNCNSNDVDMLWTRN